MISVPYQQLAERLALQTVRTEAELLEAVEHRFPTSIIRRLLALGFAHQDIDALVIPTRTLSTAGQNGRS